MTGKDDTTSKRDVEQSEGQVSEVASMDPAEADTPISDDQSVAGNPEADGAIEDGQDAGPNGKPGGNVESNRT